MGRSPWRRATISTTSPSAAFLHSIGRPGAPPSPPLNLVGDYAGGLYLAFGIVSAILSARESGVGQVVDAAVCDASAHLMTSFFGQAAAGVFSAERGTNVLDGGAPYYDVYECKDGRYASVAAIEPKFFAELLRRLGTRRVDFPGAERSLAMERGAQDSGVDIQDPEPR